MLFSKNMIDFKKHYCNRTFKKKGDVFSILHFIYIIIETVQLNNNDQASWKVIFMEELGNREERMHYACQCIPIAVHSQNVQKPITVL